MNRADPFTGYSIVLRAIVYGIVPVFGVLQFFRLKRALHVFQLEAYKRSNFLKWSREHADKRLFMRAIGAKKPLVMTGRIRRLLTVGEIITILGILLPSAFAHLVLGGAPADLIAWALMTLIMFFGIARIVCLSDWMLGPVQGAVNRRYLRSARRKLDDVEPLVIGVTGSFGKTSTKFAVAHLLGGPNEALATPGSYNTTMGVVRAINENLAASHNYFVVEMGARRPGDIKEIAELTRPRIAVLTAIGPAHLESFGSMDAIRAAKFELIEALDDEGVAIINSDDPELLALAPNTSVSVVRYGLEATGEPDVSATEVKVTPRGTEFTIIDRRTEETREVTTRLLGRHAIVNVLGATAVSLAAGRSLDQVAAAVATLEPVEHRLQIIDGAGGVTVIDDAFNSNPDGAAAALEVLAAMPANKRVVVTPGIVELGPQQAELNERFGEHAGRVADEVIVVAKLNREALVRGARRGGRAIVVAVDTLAAAQEELKGLIAEGDVVLFENDLPDQYEG